MYYVKYTDDFIPGFTRQCKETKKIYNKVTNKLEKLLLKINSIKFNIRHNSSKNIKYLGVYMRFFSTTN